MFEIGTKRVSAIKLSSMNNSGARLPHEYQEVEYIQSSGTQFIDTGMAFTNDTKVDLDICFPVARTGWTGVMGCQYTNVNASWAFGVSSSTATYQQNNRSVDWNWSPDANTKYKITNDGRYIYIDGVQAGYITNTYDSYTTPGNGTIFKVNYTGGSSGFADYASARVYACKIYDSSTLVRNFVPCYRVSDGVIGMYDLVNDQFYTNAGSGTFTKGRDILYGINSHTLRYYPFASNVADRAGQGATGTVNGTVSYSDNGIVISGDSGYVTGMTNGIANRDTYTQIFRARYTSFPDNYGLLIGDSSNYNTNSSFALELGGSGGTNNIRYYNFSGSTDVLGSAQGDIPSDTYFHLYVITANNGVYNMYRDGEFVCTGLSTGVTINDKPNMNLGRSSYYGSQREGCGEIKDYIVEDRPRSAQKIKDFCAMYNCIDLASTVETTKTTGNNQYFYGVNITTKKALRLKGIKFYGTTGGDVSGTLRITFGPYADSSSYNEFSISSVNSLQDYIYRFNSPYDLASGDTVSISFKVSDTGRLLMNNTGDITFPVDGKNVTFNYGVHTAGTNGQSTSYSYGIKGVVTGK